MFSIAIDLVHDVRLGKLCSKLWNHESGLFEPPRNLLKLPIISLRYTLHTVSTVPLFNACPSNNAAHFRALWFFKMKYLRVFAPQNIGHFTKVHNTYAESSNSCFYPI